MAIFRGVGGSGSSSDNSFLQEVTAQATTATTKANEASASATSAEASATSAANSLATIQNTEVTSASFNTGDGVLTLTKLGGATVTADLDGRFLTSYTETNDLSSAVTWVNVPNAYITEGSVTQHQAALTITESQISDLQSYLTSYTETNNLTTAVTWANVPDNFITQSSVTQHQAALSITESQISDLQSYLTSETSHADVLVDGDFTSNGFMKRTGAGTYAIDNNTYLTSEANDLSTSVTWANVPDANITQSSVTQHQGALSITESQISDLQTYLTAETNDLSTTVTWANVPDANITESSVTQHLTASNVSAAGALMDSEVTNLAQVKAFDSSDYATAAQGSTADSALQNLVEDTTPQLGGDLDLNGNDITGTGNISADTFTGGDTVLTQTGTLTSDAVLTLKSTDSGNVSAPHLLFDRVSSSPADNDGIGSVVFQGRDSANQATPYITIVGKADDVTNATEDGQLEIYTRKAGVNTKIFDLTSTKLTLDNGTDLDVAGDITVGGTVDGRDVATDGARLDTIPYHRVNEVALRTSFNSTLTLTTSLQNVGMITDIIHPSTPVDCSRYVDLKLYLDWRYVNSGTNDLELQAQVIVPANATVVNMGTVTMIYSSSIYTRSGFEYWGYVSGDYTHHFTEFGRVNSTGLTTSAAMRVRAWQYDEANDRTYFLHDSNPGVSLSTGDTVYWHPYDWESAGTTLTKTIEIDERYVTAAHQSESLKFKVAYDDSRLTYRFKLKELTTYDSAILDQASVTFTDVGKV